MKAYNFDPDWANEITYFYKRDPRTSRWSGLISRGFMVPSSNRRMIDYFTLITEAVTAGVRSNDALGG